MASPATEIPGSPDPLLAPPTSFETPPLLSSETPPMISKSMLDHSPVLRRLENLDAMRILCFFVIILSHVTEPFLDAVHKRYEATGLTAEMHTPVFMITTILNVCGRFGVPCFLMISFYIYWHQLFEKNRTWGELFWRRMRRMAPAFVCWSLFYFSVHKFLAQRDVMRHDWRSSMWSFGVTDWHVWVRVFVFGQAEIHLYYLPLVIQCLLLLPLLNFLWKRPPLAWTWVIASTCLWAFGTYGVLLPPHSIGHAIYERVYTFLRLPGLFTIAFLMFPLQGMMFAGQNKFRAFVANSSTWFWIGLLVFGFVLHACEGIALTRWVPADTYRANVLVKVGRIISGFAVFGLFIRNPLMRDPFPRLSRHSFGMHFLHPAIILILSMFEFKFLPADVFSWQSYILPMLFINLVLTFFITFGLCLLISRSKRLEFLVV